MPVCVYVTEREREEEGGLLRLKVDDGHLFAPHFFVENVSNVYSNIPPSDDYIFLGERGTDAVKLFLPLIISVTRFGEI